jgi:hypothetical protein
VGGLDVVCPNCKAAGALKQSTTIRTGARCLQIGQDFNPLRLFALLTTVTSVMSIVSSLGIEWDVAVRANPFFVLIVVAHLVIQTKTVPSKILSTVRALE